MLKNLTVLYSIITSLILIIVLLGGYILLKNNLVIKSDTQKWSDFKPILVKDSEAYNNFVVKSDEVAKKHYSIIRNIDCQKLDNFKDSDNCQKYKDITIKQVENPDQIKKNVLGSFSEYESWLSGAANF